MIQKNKFLILLCCLFCWMWAAADPIHTTVGSGSICPGDEIVVPVTVSNCNGVAAISLTLNFDATKVSFQGYQNLNSSVSTMLVNSLGGSVYMSWANMNAINVSDGTLVELRFTGISGNTNLSWNTNQCEYSDVTGTALQANYHNGSVNVYAVPYITSNPTNRNLTTGQSTTFEVGASGQGLSYQWQIKTAADNDWQVLGSDSHHSNVNYWRLNVNNVTIEMNGNQYRCVVSGTCGMPVTSNVATLTVQQYIPTIVTSVGSVSSCANEVFSVPVTVTNCNNVGAISLSLNYNPNYVTYLGYENANPQLANGSVRVNAANGVVYFTWASSNQTLEIGNGQLVSYVFKARSGNSSLSWNVDNSEYSNLAGQVLPSSFNGSSLNIYYAPSINTHPSDKTVTEGSNTNFSVSASGQGLTYRWQMSQDQGISWEMLSNGGHYSNVTSSTLYVNNVQSSMEGLRYRCVVNGTCEPSATSNYATLHVQSYIPTIVTTAGSLNSCSQTEFGIPISVTNCNNVGAISLTLSYNSNVLTYAGYEGLNPALGNGQLQVNAFNGKVYIAWASIEGANIGNGNLLTLNFTAQTTGTSSLTWNSTYCEYANPQGMPLSASYSNGNVSVGDMSFSITTQPSSHSVTMEENTTFSVATSGPTTGYQWQVSQNSGASWSNISSGGHYANPTTSTLNVNNVTLEMNGYRYRCVISGSCGVQYSSAATLTVQLPPNYYEITLAADPAEGGTVAGAGAYMENTPCTVIATPSTGYRFVSWTENGIQVSTNASYTFTVGANRDLVAHFTLQELSIVANIVPVGGGTVNGGGTYLYGDHVLLTAIPATGYVFENWTENGNVVSTSQSISFTAQVNRTLEANFSVLQVSITAIPVPASNGNVEGAGTYTYGTQVMLIAHPEEGFELANWTENGTVVSTNDTLSFMAETDRNLEAHFIIQSLNIAAVVDPEGSGTVSGTGTYNYGDPVVLTATPLGQFQFLNWTENGEEISMEPTISFTAYSHRNLVAHFFATITIAVSANPEEGGTVQGSGTYNYSDPVTLIASPNTGYTFVNWTENGTVFSTESTISFMAEENRSFVANFEMIMHHINVSANLEIAGTVSGGGDYQEGTQAVVSALPNNQFEFVRWTENGTSVSVNPNYIFTVWDDRNLVAEFKRQITDTIANACDAFVWHGHTCTSNGVYYDTLTSYLDIDSIVALHLSVYPSYHFNLYETACDVFYWDNTPYTESDVYTNEYQSIHGCDSIVTLHLTINHTRPLGNFTYLSPANEYINRYTDIDFAWDTVPNANTYDLYFWQGDDGRPAAPTVAGLTSSIFHYNGLQNNATYHWCVVAKNECVETESSERTFTCQLLPMLSVIPQGIIDFGEIELGQSRTKTIAVSATALPENISYSFLDNAFGQDSEFFNITPSTNWNSANGGSLQVTFTPDATHLYYNTALRIVSGTLADTIYLTGSLANRFVFSTNVEESVYSANDEITITGHVEDILGNAVSNLDVDVYLIVMGSRITLQTVSDANGDYSVVYSPRYSESGYYKVGSCEKGKYANTEHDAFDIPGMGRVSSDFIIWQVPQDNTLTGSISIRNRSRIPLSNIQVTPISLPDGCTVDFTGTSLGSLETGELQYVVSGTVLSTGSNYEEATFLISSDAGITMNLTCYYYCYRGRGELDVYPYSIATTMTRNRQKMLSFQITNNGVGETGPITIDLPNVEWMSVMGGNTLESIPVGDSCAFTIKLAPDDNVSLNQYTGTIAVNCANGNGISIPYQLEATSDSTGTLVVDVTDDYTFNTNNGNGPHLAGANVTITGLYSLQTVAQGVTGEDGHFVVEDIPEGYYYLTVQARSHKEYNRHIIYIEGGKMHWKEVYLQFQAISYSWNVVPTEIPDEYEFELVCNYKTNVPVPVVVLDYPQIMDSLAYGDSLQFEITLTNYGLVDALEVQIVPPTEIEEYDFYPLFDYIDTLHANASVTVPCTMTRTQRVRSEDNTDCVPGYWKTYDYWYCNRKKVREIKQDRVWIARMCPPKDIDNPPTTPPNIDDDEEWVFDWDPTTIIPPVLPPNILPQIVLPPLPVLPNQGTIIPQNNVEYVTPTSDEDCYPCWKVWATIIVDLVEVVVPSFSRITCVIDAGFETSGNSEEFMEASVDMMQCLGEEMADNVVGQVVEEIGGRISVIYTVVNFVTEVREVCRKIQNCVGYRSNELSTEAGVALDQLGLCANYYQSLLNRMTNLFQEEEWVQEKNLSGFLMDFYNVMDTANYLVSPQSVQQLKETCEMSYVNDSIIQRFADRWNRSVQYWNEGYYTIADLPVGYDTNFVQIDTMIMVPAHEAIEAAEAYGFNSIGDMLVSSTRILKNVAQEHTNDVCAKVSVSFKQTMTMTREAFDGILKIYNGHTTDAMENINVDIIIKDADGVDKTSLFQINVVSLDQISGVDGSGILNAMDEGIVQFQMIPTIAAAPDSAMIYSFGGSFTFLDPFSGETMTYQLYPVELTVNPGPNLLVDYFVQRNIISDDPLTDTVEAAEPAEIAMMIRNVGAGDANNVFLESSQPAIVDNENGLLVQFDMVGAAMNGEQRPLSLTDIPFGTIRSQSAGIAEWYFTSSLMGRIIHSTPHVIHNNSYGNPNLSLVTELNSHELIKAIRAYGTLDDGINDFFVNETVDFNHTPDKIYFSHGGTAGVKKVLVANTEGIVSNENSTVLLNINPIAIGWNYACVSDPGQGLYEVISCTRNDGQEIPLNNVWVTHVTMFDDDAPIHENKLHIVDTIPVQQTTTYTLVFAKKPSSLRIFNGNVDVYWTNAENWEGNIIPQVDDEVLINGICQLDEDVEVFSLTVAENQSLTIPAGRILTTSGTLASEAVSRLIIEDGGQLVHRNEGVQATVKKDIAPYTSDDNGWNLIASPLVGITNVAAVPNMLSNNYDLYYYNEPTHYWINQEDAANNFAELVNGKGYLYANSESVVLEFPGTLRSGNTTVTVPLFYTENNDLAGFNLVGNPFVYNLTSYASHNVANGCFQLNEDGSDLMVSEISEANPLKPAEGFFVKATGEGASVTFSPSRGATASPSGSIYVELLDKGKLIDRLIVKVEGEPLEKLSLNETRSKVFAMQGRHEVAIVPCEGNEQPVRFKAAKNGTYTINVYADKLEFDYLHLIDNLTGADVDLLVEPSYTFEANMNDYASRFRLVFSVSGDDNGHDTPFAYINNGNIIIIGAETGAVLQIVDMTGRVLVCRDASNASAIATTGMAKGMYILRLINGDEVKTQKIVVR